MNAPHVCRPLSPGLSTVAGQRGQALVLALFASVLVIVGLFAMFSMGEQSIEKIRLQNTADAAAYSAAVAEARDYNFSAYTNRAMVANQVAVAQFVGLTSWFRNMSAFANGDSSNAGRVVYDLFMFDLFPSPLSNIYKKFLKAFGKITGIFDEGKGGSTFMSYAVTVLDGLIKVYGTMQTFFHYGTALSVAQTIGAGFAELGARMAALTGVDWFTSFEAIDGEDSVVHLNDPNAHITVLGGLPYLIWHLYQWYNFTESKDPNTDKGDGPDADRFAQVTMDSLDDFSRDRSTVPAWGFYFFYAPPLTYIDPTRFVPYQNGALFMPVIHRGGTELKLTDASGNSSATTPPAHDGSQGVDCHGNPVGQNTGAGGGRKVGHYSDLAGLSASACNGDTVTVTDNNDPATEAPGPNAGIYVFKDGAWIDPASLSNTTGTPDQSTTSTSKSEGRGAPGSKSKTTWTALDASSWAGLDLIWISIIGIPIPLPLPFAPPWVPLSHGAAQSGKELKSPTVLSTDNNFGTDAPNGYGQALASWTTKIAAEMQQSSGAGKTLEKSTSVGGLTTYRDVKNVDASADNLVAPALVVEIEKSIDDMAKSPGGGQFQLNNGAPHAKMRALSKSEVYFSRPTDDDALAWFKRIGDNPTQVEVGSLYNPYWQPRLAPNNFLEQYISMESLRAGL